MRDEIGEEACLGDDLLWGAEGIARELKRTRRQTVHLLENGRLPAIKIGGTWVSSRRVLQAHFDNLLATVA
jgi:hypothetical protein